MCTYHFHQAGRLVLMHYDSYYTFGNVSCNISCNFRSRIYNILLILNKNNSVQHIMSSQIVCCSCDVFTLAKIITGIEIGLSIISFIGTEARCYPNYYYDNDGYIITAEILLTIWGVFVIYWAYLATEYIGIHKKMRCLIIFNCVIRVILIVLLGLASIVFVIRSGFFYGLMFTVPMSYMIFRTWLQFKIFKAVKEFSGFTMSEQAAFGHQQL